MEIMAEGAAKWYYRKRGTANRFFAVQRTDLTVLPGTLAVLTGRSGSGKTTLLHMLGGLLRPDEGRILSGETDLYAMDDKALSRFRNENIGVIPQGYTAIRSLSVLENVLLPQMMYQNDRIHQTGRTVGRKKQKEAGADDNGSAADGGSEAAARARSLLERFEMLELAEEYPEKLSGGEQRRLAVARALAGRPGILLADEPTGDLDDENTRRVMEALREVADQGAAVLVVTHETDALSYADACYRMSAGVVETMNE